ncbi:hypothetical protein FHS01_001639 [Longimicrobium terrae]|uniref:Uncharacterized protein n=1 Tax=Longimicrobium terrae TaxID=1639882 RepID=A0A841GMK5_9BACT|nr:hypothetical protein [Longimicrobium terrae]MBB6070021.1 hypothetical protein [Longimicrobium terrae]
MLLAHDGIADVHSTPLFQADFTGCSLWIAPRVQSGREAQVAVTMPRGDC